MFTSRQVSMAVAENAGSKTGSSGQNLDNNNNNNTVVSAADSSEVEKSKTRSDQNLNNGGFNRQHHHHQDRVPGNIAVPNDNYSYKAQVGQMHANGVQNQQLVMNNDGYGENGDESFKRDIRDLAELLSKLNPIVEEFVPPSLTNSHGYLAGPNAGFGYPNNFILQNDFGQTNRRRNNVYNSGKRRIFHKIELEKG